MGVIKILWAGDEFGKFFQRLDKFLQGTTTIIIDTIIEVFLVIFDKIYQFILIARVEVHQILQGSRRRRFVRVP